jgi:tetratricopeptide (TPR) repeat protein
VMANGLGASVQKSNQFDQATFNLELEELVKVLASEGSSFDSVHEPGKQLSQPLVEQLYSGPNGELRVIGPDMFKDYARRHLLLEMIRTRQWLENLLGLTDDAETFRKTMWSQFQGMRMMEVTYDFEKESEHKTPEEQVVTEGVKWYPWEIAAGDLSNSFANARDHVTAAQFYKDGLPFGTAYNLAVRARTLEDGAVAHPEIPNENPRGLVMDYIENSAYLHEHPFGGDTLERMILGPHGPAKIYPPVADLRALAPDSFEIFAHNRPLADLFANSRPWWDYDLAAIYRIERYKALLDDATLNELLRKHAALEPDAYFQLGQELRAEGKSDEAAEADRKGFDEGYDEVGKANLVGPLVNYYFDHGRRDEALQLAKTAAATFSEMGLMTYCNLLEKMGRLSEAADCAQAIYSRYKDHAMLDRLFAAHPDTFADQNVQLVANRFPQGLAKADFASFQGPPQTGCRIVDDNELLEQAGLQPGDIIVAMDGYRVESEPQYRYLRDRSRDPHMDLIIWRGSRYLIAHVSAPDRRFLVRIETYPSPPPRRP